MKQPSAMRKLASRAALACAAPVIGVGLLLIGGQRVASARASVEQLEARICADAGELDDLARRNLDAAALRRSRTWLARQQTDALEPALVIAELTAACRSVGADVEGIRPLDEGQRSRPRAPQPAAGAIVPPAMPRGAGRNAAAAAAALPEIVEPPQRYRIAVRADYAMLGELMDACSRRRLPVRVTAVTVTPTDPPATRPFAALRAEITIEAYRPPPGTAPAAAPAPAPETTPSARGDASIPSAAARPPQRGRSLVGGRAAVMEGRS